VHLLRPAPRMDRASSSPLPTCRKTSIGRGRLSYHHCTLCLKHAAVAAGCLLQVAPAATCTGHLASTAPLATAKRSMAPGLRRESTVIPSGPRPCRGASLNDLFRAHGSGRVRRAGDRVVHHHPTIVVVRAHAP